LDNSLPGDPDHAITAMTIGGSGLSALVSGMSFCTSSRGPDGPGAPAATGRLAPRSAEGLRADGLG
ncbi:MAG: hypothetical protein ACRDUV_01170, partial [Pseudonocardiaceae bacterium]